MDRRHGERRIHMRGSVKRVCADLISNEGTEARSAETFHEQECGLDADGYCQTHAAYVCTQHWQANHEVCEVARR